MGIVSKITRFFEGHIETSDHHEDERLRTRYYKATKDKLIGALEAIISKDASLTMLDVSKERGEVAATITQGKKGILVLTVISVGPYKTSVDMSYTVDRGTLGGSGMRLIERIYSELDSQFSVVTL